MGQCSSIGMNKSIGKYRPVNIRVAKRIILFLSFIMSAFLVRGQEQTISISDVNTVGDVLKNVTKQTGFTFAYNKSKFDISKKVSITESKTTIADVLDEILRNTGFSYKISGRIIVLIANPILRRDYKNIEIPSKLISDSLLADDRSALLQKNIGNYIAIPPKTEKVSLYRVKTNLLYWGTATANAGFEVAISNKLSLSIEAGINSWEINDSPSFKHWMIQPELRYWIAQPYKGHFVGIHAIYSKYDIGDVFFLPSLERRYKGSLLGAGISYGYSFPLSKKLDLDVTAGFGLMNLDYDKYHNLKDDNYESFTKNRLGITKIGTSLIYKF